MDKLMTLGIALSVLDNFSKPMAKVQDSLGAFVKKASSVNMAKVSDDLSRVDTKLQKMNKLKTTLGKKFKKASDSVEKLQRALREASKEEERLQKQKLTLYKQFKKGKISASHFRSETKKIETQIKAINNKKISVSKKFERAKQASESTASSLTRVAKQISRLNNKKLTLSQTLKHAKNNADQLNKKMQRLGLTLSKYGALSAAAGRIATGRLTETVFAFKEVQKAQGDLASLGIDATGIEKITDAAKRASREYAGVTMPEFIRASYDIKSGIASLSDEGVAKFTALASMTGRATKSTTEEMTKLFALGYGIFKNGNETDIQFAERFSASIATAVQVFRTEGNDLTLGLSNIGAIAKKMGVTLEEELAVIGNAKDAFNSASEAGTGYRAFLANAVGAQKKLGLSFVDTNGKLLPMRMILEQVRKKFGDLDAIEMKQLKDAFGSDEAVKIITALMDKTDALAASERKLASAKLSTVESMAKSRNKGHEFTLMMQKLSVLSSAVGAKLSPLFDAVAGKIAIIADKIESFINTTFGQGVVYVVAGLSALALVLGVAGLAVGAFTAYIGYAGKALALLKMFSSMAAAGMLLLKSTMSPIVLTVAAIAGAVFLLTSHWSKVYGWFASLWEGVASVFKAASEWIINLITDPIATISSAWISLKLWFDSFLDSIAGAFASGATYIAKVFTSPIAWIRRLWAKMLNWLGEKIDKIKGIVNSVSNYMGFKDVFKIGIDGKGGAGGDDGGGNGFQADKYTNGSNPLVSIDKIAKNTEPINKIFLKTKKLPKINMPTVAPLSSSNSATHTRRSRSGGSGGGTTVSTTASGGKNYTININVVVDQAHDITSQLASVLPDLIRDIESGQLARGLYDL